MTTKAKKQAPSNSEIAVRLDELAERLDAQAANEFRVRAYRTAAETIRALDVPVSEIVSSHGADGLMRLPGIGPSLARTIGRLARARNVPLLERLRRDTSPEAVFTTVPGIGPEIASRIHDAIGVDTLWDLQAAAYDGRLSRVPGIGPKRIRAVRESLATRFRRREPPPRRPSAIDDAPPVEELLSLDAEYREKAAADQLPRIAPRRFNPTAQAWLPVMETVRGGHPYTVMFSNTARAHEWGAIYDWVIVHRRDAGQMAIWTIVTSQFGPLKNSRIVRGREEECAEFYASGKSAAADHQRGFGERSLFPATVW